MNTDMLKIYLDYYSYENGGVKTIKIHYYDLEWCKDKPYCILSNEGVAMMQFNAEELAQVTRLCIFE